MSDVGSLPAVQRDRSLRPSREHARRGHGRGPVAGVRANRGSWEQEWRTEKARALALNVAACEARDEPGEVPIRTGRIGNWRRAHPTPARFFHVATPIPYVPKLKTLHLRAASAVLECRCYAQPNSSGAWSYTTAALPARVRTQFCACTPHSHTAIDFRLVSGLVFFKTIFRFLRKRNLR